MTCTGERRCPARVAAWFGLAAALAVSWGWMGAPGGAWADEKPSPGAPAAAPSAPAQPPSRRELDPLLRSTNPRALERLSKPENRPPLVAEPQIADMGMIPPETVREVVIDVRNPTDKALTIDRVTTSCKCTTTNSYTDHVLEPGQSIPVTVTYKSTASLGAKNQNVWVMVKDYGAPLEIPVHIEVVRVLRAVPPIIRLFEQEGDKPTGEIMVESLEGKAFTILSSGGQPPVFADDYQPGQPPRASYRVRYDLSPWVTPVPEESKMPWWWVIETDHPTVPLVEVRVRSLYTAPLRRTDWVSPGRRWNWGGQLHVNAGVMTPGQPAEVLVPTRDLGDITLVKVIPLSTDVFSDAEIAGSLVMDAERVFKVRLTPRSELRGAFQGLLMFYGSDDKQLALWVMGTARE